MDLTKILTDFVTSNLETLRKNITKSVSKAKDKDGKETITETLRFPDLKLGTGSGKFQQYENIGEFKGSDNNDYIIQIKTESRLILKSSLETGTIKKEDTSITL